METAANTADDAMENPHSFIISKTSGSGEWARGRSCQKGSPDMEMAEERAACRDMSGFGWDGDSHPDIVARTVDGASSGYLRAMAVSELPSISPEKGQFFSCCQNGASEMEQRVLAQAAGPDPMASGSLPFSHAAATRAAKACPPPERDLAAIAEKHDRENFRLNPIRGILEAREENAESTHPCESS